jgi:hypothetical protein
MFDRYHSLQAESQALRRIHRSHAASPPCPDFCQALLETYAVNDRINQLTLEQAASPHPEGRASGPNARTIVAILLICPKAVRRKWLLGYRLPIKAGYGYGIWV